MIPKPLEAIEAADIQRLFDDAWPEGQRIEFKAFHTKPPHRDKVLHTVCAFANTAGGDLLVGVDAAEGIAQAVTAIPSALVDQEKLRVEDWIRTGIEPSLPTARVREVSVEGGAVLIVRVGRSYAAPHRVIHDRMFKARNSGGNYDMTMDQIRRAYIESATLVERIRQFRAERIDRIASSSLLHTRLVAGPKLILHLVPASSVEHRGQIDTKTAAEGFSGLGLRVFSLTLNTWRYNADGVLGVSLASGESGACRGYLQLYRDGRLEVVARLGGDPPGDELAQSDPKTLAPPDRVVAPAIGSYLSFLARLGVEPPVFALMSVIGAGQRRLMYGQRPFPDFSDVNPDDRLLIPEVEITSMDESAVSEFRPALDMFWNAFGEAQSPNFDSFGNFRQK